jgi:hypothetical protein
MLEAQPGLRPIKLRPDALAREGRLVVWALGLDALAVGRRVHRTLLGSALLTLALRLVAHRVKRRGAMLPPAS